MRNMYFRAHINSHWTSAHTAASIVGTHTTQNARKNLSAGWNFSCYYFQNDPSIPRHNFLCSVFFVTVKRIFDPYFLYRCSQQCAATAAVCYVRAPPWKLNAHSLSYFPLHEIPSSQSYVPARVHWSLLCVYVNSVNQNLVTFCNASVDGCI